MAVKFSGFTSSSLNSTGFIVGYDAATNTNIRISKSTLDTTYQATLISTTNIKTINGNSILGSGDLVVGGTTTLAIGTTPITSGAVGRVLFEGTGNVLQESANLFWNNANGRLGIGNAAPTRTLDITGDLNVSSVCVLRGLIVSETGNVHTLTSQGVSTSIRLISNSNTLTLATTGNVLIGTTTDAGFKLDVNGNQRIVGSGSTLATNAFTVLNSSATELLALRNDGLVVSGATNFWFSSERGFSSIANNSFIAGGYRCSAVGNFSFAANGGMGGIGGGNYAGGNFSAVFGRGANTYLTGQFAHSSYGGGQHSFVTMSRSIIGVSISELFIDGLSLRAILPVANSMWVAKIYLTAVCNVAGGTTVLGAVFSGEYLVTIKRIGSTTSIVGTVSANEKSDASMATSVVLIDADDTNDSLRVQFTPPTTAGATTSINVAATMHLTELRY